MDSLVNATGTLRYSVKREDSDQNWWVVVDCDPNIGQYYRHLYHLNHHRCRKLVRPFWEAHITVCRNEEPPETHKHLWGEHEGEKIEFQYRLGAKDNHSPERYRSFYWLEVESPQLLAIRNELGLSAPSCELHLTIGSSENPARYQWYLENFKNRD